MTATEQPQWARLIGVSVHNEQVTVECDDCGVIAHLGYDGEYLSTVNAIAEGHWQLAHIEMVDL